MYSTILNDLQQYRKIAFCGGATGGHVYPISSLLQYIQSDPEINSKIQDCYRLGDKTQMEYQEYQRIVGKMSQTHLHFLSIRSGKLRRYLDLENIILNIQDSVKVCIGIIQSLYYLYHYHIDAVFCKGGYMALPVVIAGIILRKPLYIHESDTHYGLTHRIAYRFARKIYIGSHRLSQTHDDRVFYTGQILSPELLDTHYPVPGEVTALIGRYPQAYPILVTPGSLGSQTIFEQIKVIIPQLGEQCIWYIVCGKLNTDYLKIFQSYPNIQVYAQASPGLMGCLYRHAQGAIVRGGITTLAECQHFGIKTIASPLAHTHDQVDNITSYQQDYPDQFFYRDYITAQDIQQIFL